ncbi:MAG TPA: hypothetical protein VFI03_08895 [Solirubrobacterales bacterium]|nr:hypothetical protein [Solirubrobacterales bacterium]
MSLAWKRGGSLRNIAVVSFALVVTALLATASGAGAAELVYWDNFKASPQTIAFASTDGTGGGALNLTGMTLEDPEGIAYDSVTGRLYIASNSGGASDDGEIVFVNVDGSGAGVLNTSGAQVVDPYGVAVDPATRMVYWANSEGGPGDKGTIAYARLDGSGGGTLNTAGTTVALPYKLAIDPVGGRVYWANGESDPDQIAFANLNNTGGGGILDLTGAPAPEFVTGVAVDSTAGRVYWLDEEGEHIGFASVSGGGGGELNLTGAAFNGPYGLAIDPVLGRVYWANYDQDEVRANAIGFLNLAGGVGGISPVTAPLDGAQDPVILKSPTGTAVPAIGKVATSRSLLSCSQGGWAADFAGSFVYQAPRTITYQWILNGAAIAGATAPTLDATAPGAYACVVTATNQAGAAAQASAPTTIKAATMKLTTKKKARVQPGGVAIFKVTGVNQGDLKSASARVCVKTSKKAKKDLKAKPKCKPLGAVTAGAKDSAKLRIKVGEFAGGVYKVAFQVKGSAGKAARAKIVVAAPKK